MFSDFFFFLLELFGEYLLKFRNLLGFIVFFCFVLRLFIIISCRFVVNIFRFFFSGGFFCFLEEGLLSNNSFFRDGGRLSVFFFIGFRMLSEFVSGLGGIFKF